MHIEIPEYNPIQRIDKLECEFPNKFYIQEQVNSSIDSSLSNLFLFPSYTNNQIKDTINNKIIFSKENILLAFKNQEETRKLQKNLVGISKDIIDHIIYELKGCFSMLIKNINGNYFCSDLIKICNKNQRIIILKELSNNINEDCTDKFGSHTIQNLIQLASTEEEFKLLLASFNDFNRITVPSLHQYGSHVIQKLISNIPEKYRTYFNSIFVKFIYILSKDKYGVFAVEKFISHTKNEDILKQFLNSILMNFIDISQNKFGNYLIQYLLEKWWRRKEGVLLKNIIISKVEILSENKYSSYICSLFIKLCNTEEKVKLLFLLIQLKNKRKNNSNLSILIFINEINNCLIKSKNENNNDSKEL